MKTPIKPAIFKPTLENYIDQWTEAFYSGRIEKAEHLLEAIRRRDDFRGSWEVSMLEGTAQLHKDGLNPSEKSVQHWNEVKRYLEAATHVCTPEPCRICCQKASVLTTVASVTGSPRDGIDQTNRWLRLHEDDIMARYFRGLAWLGRGEELLVTATVPRGGGFDDFQSIGQTPQVPEAITYFTRALEDLKAAEQLTQKLPDDKVYFSKPLRLDADDYRQKQEDSQFVETFNPLDKETARDADPLPFDSISIPVNMLHRSLKYHTARTLVGFKSAEGSAAATTRIFVGISAHIC